MPSGSRIKLIRSQTRSIIHEQEHHLMVKSFEKLLKQRLRRRLLNAFRIVFKIMPAETPMRIRVLRKFKQLAEVASRKLRGL